VRFGAEEAAVLWERVVIERDIFYSNPEQRAPGSEYAVGEDEYFVMGDNCPASSDSRRWQHPGIPERNIIGKAMLVFWPMHHVKLVPGS
jgi:hypothetical protein